MPKSPLLKRKASIADLEDITKIQCSNGNWNYDPYMQGLANGMILSLNVATDDPREPLFKEAPEVWLADIHIDPNDPAHQPIPMTAATPKILYWGGRPGAKELIPQNSNYRAGIWLTDSIKVAASFGREIYRVEVTGLNNPFIVDAQGEYYAEIPTPPEMVSEGFTFLDTCDSDLIVQFALQRGHDSVIIKNVVEGFSGGGVGLSHQSGTDYVLLKEGQGKIVSSFDYKSTLDAWGMPKDPKFSAASKKAETAYTDEDLEEWLADLHVDPVEGGTVPMTAADKVARPDQWDTPEFKAWFAGSKVVDAGGNPQTFYHGTPHDIQGGAFDISKQDGTSGGAEGAFWFTSAPEVTTQFAGQAGSVIPAYLKVRNPLRIQPGEIMEFFQDHPWGRETPASVVDPTTHRAKTPGRDGTVILKDHGRVNVFEALKAGWATPVMDGTLRRAVIAKAKAGGYDGVVFHNFHDASDTPSDIVAVFSPTQIKSAIGNSGKFTPDDPRLTAGTHTAAAIDATNWEDYLVPTEEGISEEDLKQVVAASGLAYTAFQTNPLVVTLGDQYMLVKDGQEFFVEEDWGQVLEDIEYDIPFMLLNWIHGRFRLDSEFKLDRKILKLEGYYFRLDHTKKEGDLIPDIEQWVRDLDDSDIWDLVGDPDELYNDVIGSSLKDFHEQPSDVYHYTTEENLEEIIASGELETTSGTGLTNRFAAGVFTSVDPEEYADGTYGNVCLEIDLPAFLRDFPGVKLSFEPEIEDCLAKEQVVGSLNLDGSINVEPDHSGGMSYGTIIVGAAIPLKYITVDGHPLEPKKASKKDETYSMPLSEAVAEHERLVEVLKSPSHADDLKEVKEQEDELREMKEKQAHESQWDTPAFKAWFGNSKVVDRNGNPLMVFHGTQADFDTFDPTKGRGDGYWGKGFYFTDDPSLASGHGRDGNVKPVYLRILNPATPEVVNALEPENLEANGYDGIITGDGVYVVFNPNQIKSAIGNSGAFNPEDNRITASVKDPIEMGHTMTRAEYEAAISSITPKPHEVFYVPTDIEVIRNPTDKELRQMAEEVRDEFPLDRSGDPRVRSTRDRRGNIWIWKAHQGIHTQIEPLIAMHEHMDESELNQGNQIPTHRELVREAIQAKKPIPSVVAEEYPSYREYTKIAKVEWDLSPVEDHERAIKLSYKGKLGPNFEVFIYPRQDKGFDCDVHVVTGYGKRNPGVGGNKPYAPYVDFNGTELATAQALATEIKKCMDQELNSLADAARSKGDKALAYNLTREAANLYQEVLNDVTKMLVKLPNPRTNWGKPKASSQGAQARYEALVAELQAIEAKTGLYLTDTNVDRENVGAGDEQSDEFWNSMCYAAEQAAGMRAENAGQDINTLLGRTIY